MTALKDTGCPLRAGHTTDYR